MVIKRERTWRKKYEREVPGPGQYVNNYKKYNAPNFSFGGKFDKSFYQDTSSIPGPGSYQSPSTLGKKGGYLGLKNKIDKRNELPGPGAYGLKSTFSTRYGAPFGSGKRSSPNLNKTTTFPGPGSYQPMLSGRRTLGGGFGTSKRNDSAERGHAPGPGQYPINENLYRDQKAATIKGRPKTTKDDTKPGPGHYTSKSQHSSPMYSMGLKTKIKQIIGKDNPGPGGYNPDYK